MTEFIATNFNLPTIIVAALVFSMSRFRMRTTEGLNTEPQGARAETLGSRSFFK